MTDNFLIAGAKSGIGRYLFEELGGIGVTRDTTNEEFKVFREKKFDAIVHCAFNSGRDANTENLRDYLNDNVILTTRLLEIPHKKFIYISSVDVYPKDDKMHFEDEVINFNEPSNIYALLKATSESFIKYSSPNCLIMRLSAILGKYSRKNSALKIIDEEEPLLTLTAESLFNFVLYSDVLKFIVVALKNGLSGIYNITSTGNLKLREISDKFGKKVKFGNFTYNVGNISNKKASEILNELNRSSFETLSKFVNERNQ